MKMNSAVEIVPLPRGEVVRGTVPVCVNTFGELCGDEGARVCTCGSRLNRVAIGKDRYREP